MAKRYMAKRVKIDEPMSKVNDVGTSQKAEDSSSQLSLSTEQENIQNFLGSVKFKKTLVGGVSETDVWKKISELNSLYETALAAERTRFNAILEERTACFSKITRIERKDDE